jgi:hypothetical protein
LATIAFEYNEEEQDDKGGEIAFEEIVSGWRSVAGGLVFKKLEFILSRESFAATKREILFR